LPAAKLPEKTEEKEGRGAIREMFEGTVGLANAAYKIPASIVSGAVVGGYHGVRKGLDRDYEVSARKAAISHITVSTIQGQLQAGVVGFLLGGPAGAITNMALDSLSAAPGVFVFIKGGSAEETGSRLSTAINNGVKPGQGAVTGLAKGVGAGVVSSVKAAAVTGFREGKGMASGLIEGTSALPGEFAKLEKPKGPLLRSAMASGIGIASSVLSGAAGAVLPLISGEEKKSPGLLKRLAVSGATGAATGAAIGAFGGPVGMAVGGGVGMLLSLAGPAPRQDFAEKVLDSVRSQDRNDDDLGSEIANNNQSLFQSVFVGFSAGATNGWNAIVAPPTDPEEKTS
jgi:hypothetical protein